MIYAFLGLMAQGDPMGQYIFWSCAVGTLGIIFYRKQKRKRIKTTKIELSSVVGQQCFNRQIYKGLNRENYCYILAEEKTDWWLGLGEELQEDIETFVDETS